MCFLIDKLVLFLIFNIGNSIGGRVELRKVLRSFKEMMCKDIFYGLRVKKIIML